MSSKKMSYNEAEYKSALQAWCSGGATAKKLAVLVYKGFITKTPIMIEITVLSNKKITC